MFRTTRKMLEKYADVLVKFALGKGKGIKRGDVVYIVLTESARPILDYLISSILKKGAHPILKYIPDGYDKLFLQNANLKQAGFAPRNYEKGLVEDIDHYLAIIAESDLHELENVKSRKIMEKSKSKKPFRNDMDEKENAGKLTWTIALYGTEAEAKEAGMSLKQYWKQIEKACFLDYVDPIAKWKRVYKKINIIVERLNRLKIKDLRVEGKDVDLKVKIRKMRKWTCATGENIPSFEIFTTPDWRGTEGFVKFNQPLFRYGNFIKDIKLEFKNGKVVKSSSSTNEKLLKEMLKVENANRIGEFSLTDKRFSRITKFMAETLYDENIGGKCGNFHIALGRGLKENYSGNIRTVKNSYLEKIGFNLDCAIHTDIISTEDRTVTARLESGKKKVIYENGMFL